jgi:hypothetical protein
MENSKAVPALVAFVFGAVNYWHCHKPYRFKTYRLWRFGLVDADGQPAHCRCVSMQALCEVIIRLY